tara:strand:- start:27246 stop:27725 length:480 start_codon:yes stop_codon:yes gene_type:complete
VVDAPGHIGEVAVTVGIVGSVQAEPTVYAKLSKSGEAPPPAVLTKDREVIPVNPTRLIVPILVVKLWVSPRLEVTVYVFPPAKVISILVAFQVPVSFVITAGIVVLTGAIVPDVITCHCENVKPVSEAPVSNVIVWAFNRPKDVTNQQRQAINVIFFII